MRSQNYPEEFPVDHYVEAGGDLPTLNSPEALWLVMEGEE